MATSLLRAEQALDESPVVACERQSGLAQLRAFVRAAPFEWWPTLALVSGIAILNRDFVHLGFRQYYVTEVVLLGSVLAALMSARYSPRHDAILGWLCGRDFRWLHLLGLYALAWLLVGHHPGLLAVRHSMIVFCAGFVALFAFAFTSARVLTGTLEYLLVLSSTLNCAKILRNWATGLTMESEPLRVAHNEVDVICASLCLIGLTVLARERGGRHWLWTTALAAANVLILLVTVKRTAALGLAVVLVAGLVANGSRQALRPALRLLGWGLAAAVALALVGVLVAPGRAHEVAGLLSAKLSFSTEANATWRLHAWQLAWQRFRESPWLGIGYGLPILRTSLAGTRTSDPHNSYLAFLVRHGIVGGVLLLGLLGQVLLRSVGGIRAAASRAERSLRLFFLLAFMYMLVFAAFNVVLENQYEGMFFWFTLAGVFILDRCFAPGAESLDTTFAGGRMPLAWIRVGWLGAAAAYALLIASPWNYLPRIVLFEAGRQAQVPKAVVEGSATVAISTRPESLQVTARRPDSTWSAIKWALPEDLTEDFRFRPSSELPWTKWPALMWVLPEDFIRATQRATDYLLVLTFTTSEQAHKPYRLRLDGSPGQRYEARGYVAGTRRIVPLSEFALGARVRWEELRELSLILPAAPEQLSLQIESLALVHRHSGTELEPEARPVALGDCAAKRSAQAAITGFEDYDGRGDATAFAFGSPSEDRPRGHMWAASDATGQPVFGMTAGAQRTHYAFRAANPAASGWGLVYGLSLRCVDASAFRGLEFWARGQAPGRHASISLGTYDTTPLRPGVWEGGGCTGGDARYDCVAPQAEFALSETWTKVQIPWSAFESGFDGSTWVGPDVRGVNAVSFRVSVGPPQGAAATNVPAALELAVDELGFY